MTADRSGFLTAARHAFAFLPGLGFFETSRAPSCIRFSNSTAYVQIFHGRGSHQLGVEFGRFDRGDAGSVDMASALELFAPERAKDALFQTGTPSGIERGLRRLAGLVESECGPLLGPAGAPFDRVYAHVIAKRVESTNEAQYHRVRTEAAGAWVAKEFARALELYGRMEVALTPQERRRLDFLLRRSRISTLR